ncbi:hypothetical protein AALF46_21985, partial [Bacteroides xylanisolvens]
FCHITKVITLKKATNSYPQEISGEPRERLIIVQPFLLAQSCHLTGTTVSIWWHWSANTMAQGKALSTDYLFSSSLGATT